MNTSECCQCGKAKAQLTCGACQQNVCKSCAHFLDESDFSFLVNKSEIFSAGVFCSKCFDQTIGPQVAHYQATLEQAKNVNVYLKKQSKETRLIKRLEKPVHVVGCADRDETMLRLAFLAAQKGFNSLVDVEIGFEKVRDNAYQTCIWHGVGVPVQIEGVRIIPDRALWQNPN